MSKDRILVCYRFLRLLPSPKLQSQKFGNSLGDSLLSLPIETVLYYMIYMILYGTYGMSYMTTYQISKLTFKSPTELPEFR